MAFKRDTRSGGGRDFGRRDFGRDRDRDSGGDREMFKTTCGNCNKDCEVPFRPNGSKPVYCRDCFRTMGNSDTRRPSQSYAQPQSQPQPQYDRQFEDLNRKLDTIIKMLNAPAKPEKQVKSVTSVKSIEPTVVKPPVTPEVVEE